jgi:hypothetical protein
MPSYDFEVWQDGRVLHDERGVEIEVELDLPLTLSRKAS